MEQMAKWVIASSTGKGFDQLAEAVLDASTGESRTFKRVWHHGEKTRRPVRFFV
jgi:hypothetical protein